MKNKKFCKLCQVFVAISWHAYTWISALWEVQKDFHQSGFPLFDNIIHPHLKSLFTCENMLDYYIIRSIIYMNNYVTVFQKRPEAVMVRTCQVCITSCLIISVCYGWLHLGAIPRKQQGTLPLSPPSSSASHHSTSVCEVPGSTPFFRMMVSRSPSCRLSSAELAALRENRA